MDARRLADPAVAVPVRPDARGLSRNRLPLIARWKIFDNLRRSQLAPATVALLLLAWTVLPGSPAIWTAAVVATLAFPLYPLALAALAGPRRHQPIRAFLRALAEDARAPSPASRCSSRSSRTRPTRRRTRSSSRLSAS